MTRALAILFVALSLGPGAGANVAEEPDGILIAGRVLDESGQPLEGVRVKIEPVLESRRGALREFFRTSDAAYPDIKFPAAVTDKDGRFELVVWGRDATTLSRFGCEFQARLESAGRQPFTYALGELARSRMTDCPPPEDDSANSERFDPEDSRLRLPPVVMVPSRWVTVRVDRGGEEGDGESVAQVWVKTHFDETPGPEGPTNWRMASTLVRADDAGVARLPAPPEATITAWLPEHGPDGVSARDGAEDVDLRLRAADPQRLRVLSPQGPPLNDAAICLQPGAWCAAVTDVDGLATLHRPAEATRVVFRGAMSRDDGESWEVELPARTYRGDDLLEIDLGAPRPAFDPDSGPSLMGRVVSEDGQPLAGAEVYRLEDRHRTDLTGRPRVPEGGMVRTASDGTFQITAQIAAQIGAQLGTQAGADGEVSLEIWADDHLTERLEDLRPNVAVGGALTGPELEVTLRRALRLEGVVRSASGEPLMGVDLAIFDPSGVFSMAYPRTLSGPGGAFSLGRIDPSFGGLVLFASYEGYVTLRIPLHELAEPPEQAEVILHPAVTLSGRVVDPEGAGVADAEVGIVQHSTRASQQLFVSSRSGPDGSFALEGLHAGTWDVSVERLRFERKVQRLELAESREVELRIEPLEAFDVEGRLVGPGALGGVELGLATSPGGWQTPELRAATDGAGAFRFVDVPTGRYAVELLDDPRLVAEDDQWLDVEGPTSVEVRLRMGATIRGRILGIDPERLDQVTVRGPGRGSVDAAAGTYRLEGAAPGPATVTASLVSPLGSAEAASVQAQGRVTVEPDDEEVVLDLDFESGLDLAGEVIQSSQPLDGVVVRLRREGSYGAAMSDTATDRAGRFEYRGLTPSDYRVEIYGRGFDGLLASRKLRLDDDRELVIEVAESVEVAGRVVDAETGDPLPGVRVVVTHDPARHLGQLTLAGAAVYTLRDGEFRFPELPSALDAKTNSESGPGTTTTETWHVVASRDGFATASLELPPGGADDLVVRMEAARELKVSFHAADGVVPTHASAWVLDDEGRRMAFSSFQPGMDGRAVLHDLSKGRWRLLLRGSLPRGGAVATLVDVELPGSDLDVVAQRAADLEVSLAALDANEEAEVELFDATGRRFQGTRPTQEGRLRLENLPPGAITLRARSRNRTWSRQLYLAPGSKTVVALD